MGVGFEEPSTLQMILFVVLFILLAIIGMAYYE